MLIGLAVVLAVATGACAFLANFGERDGRRRGSVAAPGVNQARWRVTTAPAGVVGKLEESERRRVRAQAEKLSPTIRRFFNSMFLYPNDVPAIVKQLFSTSAATALKRSRAGLPRAAADIKVLRRVARIGIDVSGASRAAAKVRVVAKGVAGGNRFAVEQDTNLWLARRAEGWKVIGFKIDQRPWQRERKRDDAKRDDAKRDDVKRDDAKRRSKRSNKKRGDR